MEIVDYILDGLEAALELERELGVRSVEIDRGLLAAAPPAKVASFVSGLKSSSVVDERRETRDVRPPVAANRPIGQSPNPSIPKSDNQAILPLVFLHDRPLSPKGVEMMAKIIAAMGRTAETAPIAVVPPAPQAKVVVVLGGRAMKLYFPGMRGEPGQWLKSPTGGDVLITYSPEYILRFGTVTPAVEKLKKDMWRSLKAVMQRLR